MIKFSGYKLLVEQQEENDKKNIILFLSEVPQVFDDLWESHEINLSEDIGEKYTSFYQSFKSDFINARGETNERIKEEIEFIKKRFKHGKNSQTAKFGYWRLKTVGLSGNSLKLKLNTNKANWQAYYNRRSSTKKELEDSNKEDIKTCIDYLKGILSSLFDAWNIGEIGKELLDIFSLILSKLATL